MSIGKNVMIYIIVGIIVLAGVLVFASSLFGSQYSVAVSMTPLGSSGVPVYNGLYPYNTTFFSILVNNTGSKGISNLPVVVYVNGTIYKSYNVSIPKGQGAKIQMNYTYMNSGNFTFKTEADPAGLMNIRNRSGSKSSVTMHINAPSNESPYYTLPQGNTTDIQTNIVHSNGLSVAYLFGGAYNASLFNNIFGPPVSGVLLNFISPYTNIVYSAYAKYTNGSSAYTAWLQGTISPYVIEELLGSRNLTLMDTYVGNVLVRHGGIGNNTTICMDGQKGWTKLTFYTGFSNVTCDGFVNNADEGMSSIVGNALDSNNAIINYQNAFIYSNSSSLGSSVMVNSTGISTLNIFYNQYGWFITTIKKVATGLNASPVCYGEIYNSTPNTSICGSSMVGIDNLSGEALVNTTEIFKNYRLSVYSLVNESDIQTAFLSSAGLINSLGVNETPINFTSFMKNTCGTQSQNLTCEFNAFNHTSDVANMTLTNSGNSRITLNGAICYFAYGNGQAFNATIDPNASINVSLSCGSVGASVFGVKTSYHLQFNYTEGNVVNIVNGTLNVTNLAG